MKRYMVLDKEVGETPLAVLTAWKDEHPEYEHTPLTYAGRLDPMASGKLLVLIGDECKKRDQYTRLSKEYVVEVAFDVQTDTGDVLGLPELYAHESKLKIQDLSAALCKVQGSHTILYPVFSSKTVQGKPLFMYALENTLDTITIPLHTETVHQTELLSLQTRSASQLLDRISSTLLLAPRAHERSKELGADFRQEQIKTEWDKALMAVPCRTFSVATVRVVCTSGTYMRTLANRIGAALGTHGTALSIHRTKIGCYLPLLRTGVWIRIYK